jgi:cytochrome c5
VFSLRDSNDARQRVDRTVITIGGLQVGFIGVSGSAAPEIGAYTQAALMARAQGAELIVALMPERARISRAMVMDLGKVDVVIMGGDDDLFEARVHGDTLMVEAGDRGRYLGLLRLHRRGKGAWVYDDQGLVQRRSLEARRDQLQEEAKALSEGPGREARLAKARELDSQLAALTPKTPKGPSVTFEAVPITKDIAPAPWVHEQLAGYNRGLCDVLTAATAERQCTPGSPRYVGNESCRACHAAAFTVYDQMKHAHAWATLELAGKQCDVGCIGCHTVGFEQPGGFCRLADAVTWRNVGCESCHGPGETHAANPGTRAAWGPSFTRGRDAKVCTTCHNPEHSDEFAFDVYLPKILGPGHGG